MAKNLLEVLLGIRFTSSHHWDPHTVVGLSALFFGIPACAFVSVALCILRFADRPLGLVTCLHVCSYVFLSLAYLCAIATCALADYVFIRRGHRSFYGKIDIVWAAFVFFVSNMDFVLRSSILETAALSFSAVGAFMFSGCSSSFQQWVFRHSLWHAAAGAIATYGALRLPPAAEKIGPHLAEAFFGVMLLYALAIAVGFAVAFGLLGKEQRGTLWTRGAELAAWKPVAD